MDSKFIMLATVGAFGLTACEGIEGTRQYRGPNDFIAVAQDQGQDAGSNRNDNAAVAITPDGCQVWYIDDGIEARASNRLDPVSGLPVCSDAAEPGTVLGNYQSGAEGIRDGVPRRIPTIRQERVDTRPTTGHFHTVHPVTQKH